jgi:hypothetical protein
MVMVESFIASGKTPAEGKELFDLANAIRRERAEQAYNVAMVACQAEMPVVLHDAENVFLKSTYTKLESMQYQIKPVYTRHGFALSWGEEPTSKDGFFRCIADVLHVGGHSKRYSGEYPLDGTGAKGGSNMNALQGRVSSNTYAQKDLLRSIFNITVSGRDLDGQMGLGTVTEEQAEKIEGLLKKTGVNRARFLTWLNVTEVADVMARDYAKAVNHLNEKAQSGGAK